MPPENSPAAAPRCGEQRWELGMKGRGWGARRHEEGFEFGSSKGEDATSLSSALKIKSQPKRCEKKGVAKRTKLPTLSFARLSPETLFSLGTGKGDGPFPRLWTSVSQPRDVSSPPGRAPNILIRRSRASCLDAASQRASPLFPFVLGRTLQEGRAKARRCSRAKRTRNFPRIRVFSLRGALGRGSTPVYHLPARLVHAQHLSSSPRILLLQPLPSIARFCGSAAVRI